MVVQLVSRAWSISSVDNVDFSAFSTVSSS
jgi:hypothetical protein